MAELRQFVCPNCGANITNRRNCEYCGSLLVRLTDNGINVESYISNHGILSGLSEALKENIRLQKENKDLTVATDIYGQYFTKENYLFASIVSTKHLRFRNGTKAFPNSKNGIGVIFCFEVKSFKLLDKEDVLVKENKKIQAMHERFKGLEIFNLFTSHATSEKVLTDEDKFYEYVVDFGEDAEGAARLLSDVINQVYGIPNDAQLEYITNIGDNIESSRLNRDEDANLFKTALVKGIFITPIILLILYFVLPLFGRHLEFSLLGLFFVYIAGVFLAYFLEEDKLKKKKKDMIN